jgi:hypothetical protein
MDSTALTFCMDNKLPIVVFDLFKAGNAADIVRGKHVGTLVTAPRNVRRTCRLHCGHVSASGYCKAPIIHAFHAYLRERLQRSKNRWLRTR